MGKGGRNNLKILMFFDNVTAFFLKHLEVPWKKLNLFILLILFEFQMLLFFSWAYSLVSVQICNPMTMI